MTSNNVLHTIVSKLINIDRKHRKAIEEQANRFGIHRSQHRMLMYISSQEDNISQKKISDDLEISPSAVAVTLKKLEISGLIFRKTTDNDNRTNNIFLSNKGKEIVERSKKAFENVDKMTFSNFTQDDIDQLIILLDKIEYNLNERKDKDD